MPSPFAVLASAAAATIDAVFGERFVIIARAAPAISGPMLANGRPDVNAAPVAATTRANDAFVGIFIAPGTLVRPRARGEPVDSVHGIVADTPMIDVGTAHLAARPQRGDIVWREDTGERFKITDPLQSRDLGRGLITMVPLP